MNKIGNFVVIQETNALHKSNAKNGNFARDKQGNYIVIQETCDTVFILWA